MENEEFIGRDRQLKMLQDAWDGPSSAFIPVYGRRRVGKSELILHFLGGKPAVYFLGKRAPGGLQVREFLEIAARFLDEPLLATYPARGWGDALDAVYERKPSGSKIVIALDEFQWIAEASPELPSLLQERWDRKWQRSGDIFLILCGSYVGFMEREVLGRRSPLFGRRTGQILLRPFDYREAALFHPNYSLIDRARTYFLCGGIPYYLKAFSPLRSFEMNLASQLLDEHEILYHEPEFLLREELRDIENYYAILLAIAGGEKTSQGISRITGVARGSLPYYLKQLVELGYVEKRYPLTGGKKNLRQVRYDLSDPLLRFWFRFVFPDQSQVRMMGPEKAFRQLVKPNLAAYLGRCFERLCREALPFLYAREGVEAGFEIGEYWSAATQIDLVGVRRDGWIDLGECKWGTVRSAASVERELEAKAVQYPNPQNATLARRIFCRGSRPAGADLDAFRWHTLEDLYAS